MADTSLSEKKIGLLIWQVSNLWQTSMRKVLKSHNLTLNEYLIIESIIKLHSSSKEISQRDISNFAGVDISVTSVTLKLLEEKKLIIRTNKIDNRKKNIEMLLQGNNLYKKLRTTVDNESTKIFSKLQEETHNFTNSLKLLLGKRIRIKAEKIDE